MTLAAVAVACDGDVTPVACDAFDARLASDDGLDGSCDEGDIARSTCCRCGCSDAWDEDLAPAMVDMARGGMGGETATAADGGGGRGSTGGVIEAAAGGGFGKTGGMVTTTGGSFGESVRGSDGRRGTVTAGNAAAEGRVDSASRAVGG